MLRPQFEAPYFAQLKEFLVAERQQHTCYPPGSKIFNAFDSTPFDKVKVVILGQDPYHEPGQAMGLCFSVPQGIQVPPSLVNIITEINADLGTNIPKTCGDLSGWAAQGVLLLNATLTVRAHQAGSHQRMGGRPSPMPPSRPSASSVRASSSSSGAAMPLPRNR